MQKVSLAALAGVLVALTAISCNAHASFDQGLSLPHPGGGLAAWSPNGKWVAFPTKEGIELRSVDGETRRLSTPPAIGRHGASIAGRLSWSKRGTRLHFLAWGRPPGKSRACTVGLGGGGLRCVSLGVQVSGGTWAPGGWPLVYATNEAILTLKGQVGPEPDLWRLDGPRAKPRKLLARRGDEFNPIFSPDGRKILFTRMTEERGSVWTVGADGANPRRVAGNFSVLGTSWSPDGRRVAIAGASNRGVNRVHLYLAPATGGWLRRISKEEILGNPPAWTPDGRWITYSNYSGEIRQIRPNGRDATTIATFPGEEVQSLLWSPSGDRLAYSASPFPPFD